jgi:hypothetical protein
MCEEFILTKAPGYLLRLDQVQLDAQKFKRLYAEGTRLPRSSGGDTLRHESTDARHTTCRYHCR